MYDFILVIINNNETRTLPRPKDRAPSYNTASITEAIHNRLPSDIFGTNKLPNT